MIKHHHVVSPFLLKEVNGDGLANTGGSPMASAAQPMALMVGPAGTLDTPSPSFQFQHYV